MARASRWEGLVNNPKQVKLELDGEFKLRWEMADGRRWHTRLVAHSFWWAATVRCHLGLGHSLSKIVASHHGYHRCTDCWIGVYCAT